MNPFVFVDQNPLENLAITTTIYLMKEIKTLHAQEERETKGREREREK